VTQDLTPLQIAAYIAPMSYGTIHLEREIALGVVRFDARDGVGIVVVPDAAREQFDPLFLQAAADCDCFSQVAVKNTDGTDPHLMMSSASSSEYNWQKFLASSPDSIQDVWTCAIGAEAVLLGYSEPVWRGYSETTLSPQRWRERWPFGSHCRQVHLPAHLRVVERYRELVLDRSYERDFSVKPIPPSRPSGLAA
jgi:hypothetical protein